jgi:WD40 repeat protein
VPKNDLQPVIPPLQAAAGKPAWWRRVTTRFWGFDFFISYHWNSGGRYAARLADALRKEGFDCFLDRSEFAGGDDWKIEARQALANTRRLIVVGTREALTVSEPVRDEITIFSARSDRIVPILFGSRVPDDQRHEFPALDLISERVIEIVEDAGRQEAGPSGRVLDELRHSHRVLRRRRVRALAVTAAMVLLALAALVSTLFFLNAEHQRRVAEQALMDAQREYGHSQIDLGIREIDQGNRVGLLRLHRAYEAAERRDMAGLSGLPADEPMSLAARRLMAGQAQDVGLGLLHTSEVRRAVLSPGGEWIRTLTVNSDGEPNGFRFWHAESGQPVALDIGADDQHFELEMTADWSTALQWNGGQFLRWNLLAETMDRLVPPPGFDEDDWDRTAPPHSADGRLAATIDGRLLGIWDQVSGQWRHRITLPFEARPSVQFSEDGHRLLARDASGGRLAMVDVDRGAVVATTEPGLGDLRDIVMTPDAHRVAVQSWDGVTRLLSGDTLEAIWTFQAMEAGAPPRFSADGSLLLHHRRHAIRWVDTATGQELGKVTEEEQYAQVRLSPDGERLLTTSGPALPDPYSATVSSLSLWDLRSRQQLLQVKRPTNAYLSARFSPDSQLLLALDDEGFEVYDARTGINRGRWPARPSIDCLPIRDRDCAPIGFSSDGRSVVTLSLDDRVARVVRTPFPEPVLDLPDGVVVTRLSSTGDLLAYTTRDGGLALWRLDDGQPLNTVQGPPGGGEDLRFGLMDEWLIVKKDWTAFSVYRVSPQGLERVHDPSLEEDDTWAMTDSGTLIRTDGPTWETWYHHHGVVQAERLPNDDPDVAITFSNDGKLLAVTGYGDDVRVWDTLTGELQLEISPQGGRVQNARQLESSDTLLFSPDGDRLLNITNYGTARIWAIPSGALISELTGPSARTRVAQFSPDGQLLAELDDSGITLWEVATDARVSMIPVRDPQAIAFTPDNRSLIITTRHQVLRAKVPELPNDPDRVAAWAVFHALAKWGTQGTPVPIDSPTWEAAGSALAEDPGAGEVNKP